MQFDLLWRIFLAFAKVGIFGYGGGPSMIPLVKEEVVDGHAWMKAEEFADTLAVGYSLPGPIATKMSAYVGYKLAGIPGAVAGVTGTVLPSMLAMLALAAILLANKDTPLVKNSLLAVRPVVIALLAWTIYGLWSKAINGRLDSILIAVAAFVAVTLVNVHPAIVIVASAIVGIVIYR